ncbi:AzlC family ABC transporter permease [Dinoroseobacter sp. S76]|uniref:AzlC family ABC transporter permease n=1 Tax=Dinoroseobacter sp. S76 TaxID=3415124 RepID=UPI003C7E20FC
MHSARPDRPYLDGLRGGLPFLLVVVPFGMLFGVVGTEAGLNIVEIMGFSMLVIAGAAQFTAIQLMTENAPVLVILASSLAVNLRMAMYSASIAPYLGPLPLWQRALSAYFLVDQTYAVSIARFQARPEMSLGARLAFHLGAATPICLCWYPATYFGAVAGTRIPPDYALDFALPITFLALIAPALTSLAHVAAALTATVLSLLFVGMPFSLGIIAAAICALLVGARVELWQTRRREAKP